MDKKITNTELARFSKIIDLGYTSNDKLLYGQELMGYNSGKYGWNYDAYRAYSSKHGFVAILRGYRGAPAKAVCPSSELVKKYLKKAEDVLANSGRYEAKVRRISAILEKFIDEVFTPKPKKKTTAKKATTKKPTRKSAK